MNHNLAPDLTSFVVAFVVIDLIAVLAIVGVIAGTTTAFFRTHRAVRVQRHEALVPYYRHVALHH